MERAALALVLVIAAAAVPVGKTTTTAQQAPLGWRLVWSDEFDGRSGAPPDPAKWVIESGGHGWGNNELQVYTTRAENVRQEGGRLIIEARHERFGDGPTARDYTSARLKTAGLFSQRYGRFEARIQVPTGQGIWPAFWMLGDDFPKTRWPFCGEIDIMEHVGHQPATVHSNLHGPGYWGSRPIGASLTIPSGRLADAFHLYAVEWEAQAIRVYLDAELYGTRTPASLPSGAPWVFDHPFFLLLNVAVGGNWPGAPDERTVFPQRMLVDYVRVYVRASDRMP